MLTPILVCGKGLRNLYLVYAQRGLLSLRTCWTAVLCDMFGLTATVCHYPTGCSKWNPVEHRLFSYISTNWQGKPLKTLEIMLAYIRGTTTATGLKVKAFLDRGLYRRGQQVKNGDLERLNIEPHAICPKWNYTLHPRKVQE